jgi:hypothetical protein
VLNWNRESNGIYMPLGWLNESLKTFVEINKTMTSVSSKRAFNDSRKS